LPPDVPAGGFSQRLQAVLSGVLRAIQPPPWPAPISVSHAEALLALAVELRTFRNLMAA
jgi:hypothetical protein